LGENANKETTTDGGTRPGNECDGASRGAGEVYCNKPWPCWTQLEMNTKQLTKVLASALLCTASLQAQNKITNVPYAIKYPGTYVLTADLVYEPQTGNAITITYGNVILDFQGHALSNPFTGPSSSQAIYAAGMNNITIRNGKISGFENGITFETFALANGIFVQELGQLDTVTNMTLSNQLSCVVFGGTSVTNCTVKDIGRSVDGYYDGHLLLGDILALNNVALVQNCTVSTLGGCALFYNIYQPHAAALAINNKLSGYEYIENIGSVPILAIHDYMPGSSDPYRIIGNVTIIGPVQ
jgi:hypothetical protein